MKLSYRGALALGALLTAALTGCSDESGTASPTSTETAKSSATTTITKLIGPSRAPLPPPSPTHPPAPGPEPLRDVDCGQITGSNGATASVIVFASAAGRAGCTEAITVASDYVGVPRTGDEAKVDGWSCEPQPDATIKHVCVKGRLTIGLRGAAGPASPRPPAPSPVRTTHPSSPPVPAPVLSDVNCGPVTDAGGAPRTVIAVGGPAGRVGCTEAINVATAYVTTISPSASMNVNGWNCTVSACSKEGLVIGLREN